MDAIGQRAIELNQQPYKNTLKNAKISKNAGMRLACPGGSGCLVVWAIEIKVVYSQDKDCLFTQTMRTCIPHPKNGFKAPSF